MIELVLVSNCVFVVVVGTFLVVGVFLGIGLHDRIETQECCCMFVHCCLVMVNRDDEIT